MLVKRPAPVVGVTVQVTVLQYGTAEGGAEIALQTLTMDAPSGTPVTVAVNCSVSLVPNVKLVGVMATRTPESSVTLAEAVTAESDCKVAVTLMAVGVGGVPAVTGTDRGAVYNPLVLIVPTVVLPLATPLTDQLTAPTFVAVAVNCVVVQTKTVAEDGLSVTPTVVLVLQPENSAHAAITKPSSRARPVMPSPPN